MNQNFENYIFILKKKYRCMRLTYGFILAITAAS